MPPPALATCDRVLAGRRAASSAACKERRRGRLRCSESATRERRAVSALAPCRRGCPRTWRRSRCAVIRGSPRGSKGFSIASVSTAGAAQWLALIPDRARADKRGSSSAQGNGQGRDADTGCKPVPPLTPWICSLRRGGTGTESTLSTRDSRLCRGPVSLAFDTPKGVIDFVVRLRYPGARAMERTSWQHRLVVLMVTAAFAVLTCAGLAHRAAHAGGANATGECATCRWVKSAPAVVDTTPVQSFLAIVSDAHACPKPLTLQGDVPAPCTRGPPSTRHA
jgi:hypothetical protein